MAICEACLDLVQEARFSRVPIRSPSVPVVSRRSIFNHFADLAELYDAVGEVGMQRYAPMLEEIPATGPIDDRIDRLLEVRSRFLEATAPITRALTAQALAEPTSDEALRVSREGLRRQHADIDRLFAPELADRSAQERGEIVEALTAAISPLQWEYLRRSRRNSVSRARAVIKRTLTSILRELN